MLVQRIPIRGGLRPLELPLPDPPHANRCKRCRSEAGDASHIILQISLTSRRKRHIVVVADGIAVVGYFGN